MKPYLKLTIIILFLGLHFGVSAQYEDFKQKIFTTSAEAFLSLGEDIHSGKATTEQDWEKLFSTVGYTKYLNNPKGEMIRRELQEAMLLAFDPKRIAEADSILKHPATITNMPLVLRQNICLLARKREEADSFLKHTDFLALLYRANEKTKKYLPERAWSSKPVLNDLFLIATIPDASVRDHAIFLDLNLALSMQEEELVDLFAHEFFHNYREMAYQGSSGDSFLNAFDLFQNEGIADLIDKKRNDDKIMQFFGDEFVKTYREELANAPNTLARIDSLSIAFDPNTSQEGEYKPLVDLVLFGGHPVGYYMASLIQEQGYMEELIDSYDNPVAFAMLYNQAARKKNTVSKEREYILSDHLIDHLEQAYKKHKGNKTT
ncbi:hypothetical protein HR13_02810 [Porphyromonas gulae]|uniref:DUF5700 domain-containing putative Zn-dependent protease n=1 Tax=Porphyromonas gulae TaxID=111105 RepID=UPI0003A0B980|nr:DUF5700 domain-containing putative Zn-dependent protease [Porphyromonas gulae]KGN68327.1 hypothetical protein HR09_08150 [Porphyromonas gulae]KGN80913.1 hypothetical protein HR13_02810 [Porphyromonas gulae]KGO01883.1 hypothetical protein HQ42_09775 [Porphyromonas gulae]